MKKIIYLTMLCTVISFISGCGDSKPKVDTAPFDKAITAFLSEKHMDMKVSKFKEVNIEGNKATAKCAMKALVGVGPAVSWDFTFEKKDGAWKATGYQQ